MKKWNEEKGILSELQDARQKVEEYKIASQSAERAGDYGKVAELRYGKIAQLQQKIDELSARQAAVEDPIVTEAVTPEDIAEVVAKWTGIPVAKLTESERNKTLHLPEPTTFTDIPCLQGTRWTYSALPTAPRHLTATCLERVTKCTFPYLDLPRPKYTRG